MTRFSLFKNPRGAAGGQSGSRRLARELALRLLFQHDSGGGNPDETLALFNRGFAPDQDPEQALGVPARRFQAAWPFAERLFLGVCRHRAQIDQELSRAATNWQLGRMSLVDRNLIRLAYFEMAYLDDIPAKVSLNEAVELGKQYGAEDSGAFINGLLDRMLNDLPAE